MTATADTYAATRAVVYTCTFLDYDDVFSPVRATPDAAHVLFADRRPRLLTGWRWRPMPEQTAGMNQTLANRWCKFFPHRLFPEASVSVYIDGNVLLLGDLRPLISEFLASGAAIGLFRHGERATIAEEAAFCLKVGKIPPGQAALAAAQLEAYRAAGLPETHQMTENAVVFRRHDAPGLDVAMTAWWAELERWTRRDQISLPYVLHATGLPAKIWDWSYKADNAFFMKYPHRMSFGRRIATQLHVRSMYDGPQRVALRAAMTIVKRLTRAGGPRRRRRN